MCDSKTTRMYTTTCVITNEIIESDTYTIILGHLAHGAMIRTLLRGVKTNYNNDTTTNIVIPNANTSLISCIRKMEKRGYLKQMFIGIYPKVEHKTLPLQKPKSPSLKELVTEGEGNPIQRLNDKTIS